MKLGLRVSLGSTFNEGKMSFVKQLGVDYLQVVSVKGSVLMKGDYYEVEDLIALKRWVESCELELIGILAEPLYRWDQIILGLPGRDEQIENWNKSLRNMGKAGIHLLQYWWVTNAGAWHGAWRTTAEAVGRGGAKMSGFDYEVAKTVPVTHFGRFTEKQMWDNLTYFLKAAIPVAEESHVKMVMHPDDPLVPSIVGIARIMHTVEAYDRLFEIVPSDYNSMAFCLGAFSEMLEPEGVHDAIRHFAAMGKIGSVDLRNVKGNAEKFDEVYPDEGKLDMFKTIKLLKEVGYKDFIFPEHGPRGTGDTDGNICNAFQIGYVKGLLQAVSALD